MVRENSQDNIALNHVDNIDVFLGDASCLASKGPFDLVIANINRNILLNDLQYYVPRMKEGAYIYMSGFYVSDIEKSARKQSGKVSPSLMPAVKTTGPA